MRAEADAPALGRGELAVGLVAAELEGEFGGFDRGRGGSGRQVGACEVGFGDGEVLEGLRGFGEFVVCLDGGADFLEGCDRAGVLMGALLEERREVAVGELLGGEGLELAEREDGLD